jgi:hypothetical protein
MDTIVSRLDETLTEVAKEFVSIPNLETAGVEARSPVE